MTAAKIAEIRTMQISCPVCSSGAHVLCVTPDGKPCAFPHRARFRALWALREEAE